MASNDIVEVEALLAQEAWARRLARALSNDDDAEDVVQEARIAWWRRAPDDPARARAWLGTVVRNLSHNARRARIRRTELHAQAHGDEVVPSAEETLRRFEMHRALAEAVASLREPFRQTLLLRYYEGLTSAAIARRLGIPAGTVRWRLKQALDELRARLDERPGGRTAWLAALAPLARRDDAAAARSPLAVGASAFGVAAVGLTLAALVSSDVGGQGSPFASAAGPALARRSSSAAPARLLSAGGAGGTGGTDRRDPPAWALRPGQPEKTVAGRITSDGRPVAGASLRLSSGMMQFRSYDRHATTAADGTFTFGLQPPTNWFLTVTAGDLAPAILYVDLRKSPAATDPGQHPAASILLDLSPCSAFVEGVVRDAGGGAIAGALVKVTASWGNGGVEVSSAHDGRYRMCLPPRRTAHSPTLVAIAEGYGAVERDAPEADATIDFILEPRARVHGRIVDENERPLPGVKVTLFPLRPADPNRPPKDRAQPFQAWAQSDAAGLFDFPHVAAGRYGAQISNDGHLLRDPLPVVSVSAGETKALGDVRLSPTVVVEGLVRQGGVPRQVGLWFHSGAWKKVGADAPHWATADQDGRFRAHLPRGFVVDFVVGPTSSSPPYRFVPALAPLRFVVRAGGPEIVVELPPDVAPPANAREAAVTAPGAPAPAPAVARAASFGQLARVVGYDMPKAHLHVSERFEITTHFEALGNLAGWQTFTHIVGPGGGLRNHDHVPVHGAHPVNEWRPGERIRDTHAFWIDASHPPGRYDVFIGFWRQDGGRLPVGPASADHGERRMHLATFTVEAR